MKRIHEICFVLAFAAVLLAAPVLGQFTDTEGGIVIGKVESRAGAGVEADIEGKSAAAYVEGIEVEVVREEAPGSENIEERVEARTSPSGIFMSPVESLEGSFRISRVRLPGEEEWIDVSRLSVRGDVSRYGAVAYRIYGSVAALNTIICEESPEGEYKFVMRVGPFSETCRDFLNAFPLSPWGKIVEEAEVLGAKEDVEVAEERGAPPPPAREGEVEEEAAPESEPAEVKISMGGEEEAQGSGGVVGTVVIISLVLVVLAILIGAGGRRKTRSKEREIDIGEIEIMEAEREKKKTEEAEPEEDEKEQADPTAIILEKEGWFLREFRRARVRIHWKKYDSAAVSLEKTTRFMEEHLDRLKDKKEVYTLVLHYSYLGRCYLESGRRNDALRVFKRGIELNEYNSRMCEMGLADTFDAIARSEESPTAESLSARYPILSEAEIESIMAMSQQAEPKA